MFKTFVLTQALAVALAGLVVFSVWIAVLSLILKAMLLILTLLALYVLLSFAWRKYRGTEGQ